MKRKREREGGVLRPLALLVLLAAPAAADVRTVPGMHPDVATALAFAADGDVILVSSGVYPGFTVTKAVDVVADTGARVVIDSRVRVIIGGATRSVLLAGLEFAPVTVTQPTLELMDSTGSVRVERCRMPVVTTAPTVLVEDVANVAFVDCVVENLVPFPGQFYGSGGPALEVLRSTCSLEGCELSGRPASGSISGGDGARGGPAVAVGDGALVTSSGCVLVGGRGGDGGNCSMTGEVGDGGPGGFAVRLDDPLATFRRRTTQLTGGEGGDGGSDGVFGCGRGSPGPMGAPSNAPLTPAGGLHRPFDVPVPIREKEPLVATLTGQPGDLVALIWNAQTASADLAGVSGRLLVSPGPPLHLLFLGTVPASGALDIPFSIGSIGSGVENVRVFTQPLVQATAGALALGEPRTLVVLDETF